MARDLPCHTAVNGRWTAAVQSSTGGGATPLAEIFRVALIARRGFYGGIHDPMVAADPVVVGATRAGRLRERRVAARARGRSARALRGRFFEVAMAK